MKLIELLNKIANGEIKEGTKCIKDGKIDVYTKEYYTMLNEEVEIIEKQDRWKPKEGEHYWYIDSYRETHRGVWLDDSSDNWRYTTKNVFKTEQEAEEYLKYKTALLEAEKPFVEGKENYFIRLEEGNIKLAFTYSRYAGIIFLGQDKDVAQAFIDKWHKQILKYEFGMEV